MMSSRAARALGIAREREILVAAPKISLDALKADIAKTLGKHAKVTITRISPFDQSVSSSYASQVIPASYLDLYRRAAVTCPGLPWTVLAAIGTVETGNGTNVHRSTAGAEGPMQFIPSTWAMYGYDADGDGKANIQDPVDAVFSAARYLCAAGGGRGGQALDDAIFAYNHAWWYVREVIIIANRYA
jgi:membrane-bound lytic murein transglycosylase B